MTRWRVNIGWWLLVLTGLPVITTGFAVAMGHSVGPMDMVEILVSQLGLLAINFVHDVPGVMCSRAGRDMSRSLLIDLECPVLVQQ